MRSAVVFLLVASLTRAASPDEATTDPSCRARAWVRAPDLKAGEVVQGDVKIKLNGSCDDVSSYTLGLRFAERSWVKTRRENVTLPVHPRKLRGKEVRVHSFHEKGIYDLGENSRFWNNIYSVNQSFMDQYDSEMKNPDLWLVREEERIAFEARYPLSDEGRPGHDVVKPFALLMPSTSYPPLFDTTSYIRLGGESDAADAEHTCIYFVDVVFSNGTHREIEAGYTSFSSRPEIIAEPMDGRQPMSRVTTTRESVNVTATKIGATQRPEIEDVASYDKFTLEIDFPDGRHLEQGSARNITITSHQVGPGLQRPLKVSLYNIRVSQRRTWAAKHAADNETAEKLLREGKEYEHELWPKADDNYESRRYGWELEFPEFSQEGAIKNGTTFSTEAVTVQIEVPRNAYPPFEMYYQQSVVELKVDIAVRNVSEIVSEPDLPDDEEYDWTPILRGQPEFHRTETFRATVPITVYRKPEGHPTQSPPLVHYLSPEARAPLFVDPSSVAELQQLTIEDRDLLAPLAQPKFNSKEGGDVVRERYWTWRSRSSDKYYVANTWLRKAVPLMQKQHQGADSLVQHEPLVVQT